MKFCEWSDNVKILELCFYLDELHKTDYSSQEASLFQEYNTKFDNLMDKCLQLYSNAINDTLEIHLYSYRHNK